MHKESRQKQHNLLSLCHQPCMPHHRLLSCEMQLTDMHLHSPLQCYAMLATLICMVRLVWGFTHSEVIRRTHVLAEGSPFSRQYADGNLPAGSEAGHSRLRQRSKGAALHHNGCTLLCSQGQRSAIIVQRGRLAAVACNRRESTHENSRSL